MYKAENQSKIEMSNKGAYKYMYAKNSELVKMKEQQMEKHRIDLEKFNLGDAYHESKRR